MIRFLRPRLLSISAALLALTTLAACGGRSAQQPAQVVKNATYQASQPLADRYENLEGTALFDVSSEVATRLGAAADKAPGSIDSFFILLNPKAPTEGILVRAGSQVEKGLIQKQPSRKVAVTGNVKVLEETTILSHFQERFGISLARNGQGNPVWIDNEAPLELDPQANGSPGAVKAPEWLGQSPAPGANLPQELSPAPAGSPVEPAASPAAPGPDDQAAAPGGTR